MSGIISCITITTILVMISGFCVSSSEEFLFSDWSSPNWKTCAWRTEPGHMFMCGIGKVLTFGILIPTFIQFCLVGILGEVFEHKQIKVADIAPVETYELTTVNDCYLGIYGELNQDPSYMFAYYDNSEGYHMGRVPIDKANIIIVESEPPRVSISKVAPTNKILNFFFYEWMFAGYQVTLYLPVEATAVSAPCRSPFPQTAPFYKAAD